MTDQHFAPAYVQAREAFLRQAQRRDAMKPGGQSASSEPLGVMGEGVWEALEGRTPHTFGLAEVGTHDPVRVFLALRADNWLHHFGQSDSEQGQAIKAELRECFCPADPRWRRDALQVGAEVISQAVQALQQPRAT